MRNPLSAGALISGLIVFAGCQSKAGNDSYAPQTPSLPVVTIASRPFMAYREYSASLEGVSDIEVRPQVTGYVEKIYVDEGAFVKKGQALFKINDRPYREALNNASASLAVAKANQATAKIDMEKLEPLVQNQVISPIQLQTAKAAYDASTAYVDQAKAMVANAQINIGYSLITAPMDGYVGRIHIKIGSLVGQSMDPLTNISEVKDIRAYFSVSETAFLRFRDEYPGKDINEKIKNLPPVELILSDNTVYPEKGKVELVSGQFTTGAGAIPFRASFPNTKGILRSGSTGRVRISVNLPEGPVIPQEATYELQDKTFVFQLSDSNTVVGTPVTIKATQGNYYLVDGLKPGARVVYGVERLNDGEKIQPIPMSMDSLLKARPL
jgi:membrane fusion protein (multidrug efflux system)